MRSALRTLFGVVTDHNLVVLLVLLLVSAGVAAGAGQLQLSSETDGSEAVGDTEIAQKLDYVQNRYGRSNETAGQETKPAAVYVRTTADAENALSKAALLDTLRFQQAVRDNASVAAGLGDRRVRGVANLIGRQAADDPDARLAGQIAALEDTPAADVEQLVAATLREGSGALRLLPAEYDPGTTTADSTRLVFPLADTDDRSTATAALYEAAGERDGLVYFTAGEHARAETNAQYMQNTMELVVPAGLLLILLVLGFAYRDLVDVVVGFTGVVLSVVWMFGILGWLQIPAGMSLIIGPVLIVGLSVDYGLHVFMRYREQRGADEGIREPMARGLSGVAVALGLVTLTTMVGFLSNATTEFTTIKQLAYGITLGVFATFVVSLTLVPALKVTIDRLLGRVGFERRKRPLGKTRLLEPLLSSGASLAARAAPVVLVLALVAGAAGGVAWTDLQRQSVQQSDGEVADWKRTLPGPLAWEVSDAAHDLEYAAEHYRSPDDDARQTSSVLVEGSVTDPAALESVTSIHGAADRSDIVYRQGGSAPLTSPVTVMTDVAADDADFAHTLREADTDGDGVPDRNLGLVYDALFATAPDLASQVIDREDGTYRSLRVVVPVTADSTITAQAEGMQAVAAAGETDGVSTIAVGQGTLVEAEMSQTAASVLETLLIALAAVGVLLTVVYRLVAGSATLGAVTAVPIGLVAALVIGGMWVLEVPLTLLTALLLSLVIGIGIDYNIHVSDRFAQERRRGRPVHDALVEATTGTGGALLGSTLTSAGAFSALLLHPHPQFQSFGLLVVLAMVTSFLVAVFVLPSMLRLWARYVPAVAPEGEAPVGDPVSGGD